MTPAVLQAIVQTGAAGALALIVWFGGRAGLKLLDAQLQASTRVAAALTTIAEKLEAINVSGERRHGETAVHIERAARETKKSIAPMISEALERLERERHGR
jgi:hypothetical protein